MASVELSGNQLVVVCRGTRRSTGVMIDPNQPDSIEAAVQRAISSAALYFYGISEEQGREVERINASSAAAAIRRRVAPAQPAASAQPAAPARPSATGRPAAAPARPARPSGRTEQPAQPAQQPARPAVPAEPSRTETRPAEPARRGRTAEATPRPTITQDWIDTQLREARRDDRKAQAAASALHSNSRFVERFLEPGAQRGVERTEAQKSATISLFNTLYQIPGFRLYLSSIAAQQQALPERERVFGEFITLQAFLTEPGRNEQLSAQAEARIISAADIYTRYFLLNFVCGNTDYSRYRDEVLQLPAAAWRLRNIEGARTFAPVSGRAPSDLDRAALMRLYISSPMDADTLTAASLYLRRWHLEHPERGNGRGQSRISAWHAPEIIQPEPAAAAQPAAAQPAGAAPAVTETPRVVIIGDSIIAGGRTGSTLQATLRTTWPQATVASRGVVGESISRIRSRFQRDVLDANPNTVVIEGGINGIMSGTVADAQAQFSRMISQARARSMRVVLIGLAPWAGYAGSSDAAQQRTTELNTWLRNQATTDGNIVFVDIASQLGEGSPPRLRAAYEAETDPDHLHPNAAGRDLIAAMVAQAAFGRAPTRTETRTALQDFAERNWRNLPSELYQGAQGGNPAGIITISRNLPAGETSFEGALRTLNRDDIPRALDRAFNDYIHRDRDFLQFCRDNRDYQGVALESVTLSAASTPTDRRLIMRAVQAYLNHAAGRTGDEWYGRLRDDLRMMYRDVLGTGRDTLDVNGLDDLRMLAAIGVYSWRKGHRSEAVGAWATTLNIRPSAQPAQPAVPTAPPTTEGQRRRVIHP
ncbi:GDSL-type esterase/lipase family protein [Candidatus Micrarchaeota archaeon]|nr:GDSL-type esterase/lipase family protein [Candidatus Micrarchaeota archaeon]